MSQPVKKQKKTRKRKRNGKTDQAETINISAQSLAQASPTITESAIPSTASSTVPVSAAASTANQVPPKKRSAEDHDLPGSGAFDGNGQPRKHQMLFLSLATGAHKSSFLSRYLHRNVSHYFDYTCSDFFSNVRLVLSSLSYTRLILLCSFEGGPTERKRGRFASVFPM